MKLIFPIILSALILSSCNSSDDKANAGKEIFLYNEMGRISSLDPAAASSFENIWATTQIFNGLVDLDDSLNVQPSIARSWDVDTAGTVYTFHLRNDVYFQDHPVFKNGKGRKVTAQDFEYSFTRLFDRRVSKAGSLLEYIDRDDTGYKKGFEAIDDSTFRIVLKHGFKPFLGILSMKFFSVVPKEIVEHFKDEFRRNPVGTGPFKFKNWIEGTRLVMVKNPNYFEMENGNRLPFLDGIAVSFIRDKESVFLSFLNQDLDMISGADAFNLNNVLTSEGNLLPHYAKRFSMQKIPFLKIDYIGMTVDENCNVPVHFLKREVRKAMSLAIDRSEMIRNLRNNIGIPATMGFVPPGMPGYDKSKVAKTNLDIQRSKELLYLANASDGKGLPSVALYTTKQYQDLLEFVRSELAGVGIKCEINIVEAGAFTQGVESCKMPFFRKSWIADYPDPENFLALFYSKNFSPDGSNYTHFNNSGYDNLYEKAVETTSDSIRFECYTKMEKILADESPVIPLFYDQVVRLVHNNITGLSVNALNSLNLKKVKKTSHGKE